VLRDTRTQSTFKGSQVRTLDELLPLQKSIELEIRRARAERRADAVARIRLLMSEQGLSLNDLVRALSKPGRMGPARKAKIKFRHPDSGETWSGRGLTPKWLVREMKNGKTVADFAL
jgi:DNA-binding protein H-NS